MNFDMIKTIPNSFAYKVCFFKFNKIYYFHFAADL
jgi:hypothetical protein